MLPFTLILYLLATTTVANVPQKDVQDSLVTRNPGIPIGALGDAGADAGASAGEAAGEAGTAGEGTSGGAIGESDSGGDVTPNNTPKGPSNPAPPAGSEGYGDISGDDPSDGESNDPSEGSSNDPSEGDDNDPSEGDDNDPSESGGDSSGGDENGTELDGETLDRMLEVAQDAVEKLIDGLESSSSSASLASDLPTNTYAIWQMLEASTAPAFSTYSMPPALSTLKSAQKAWLSSEYVAEVKTAQAAVKTIVTPTPTPTPTPANKISSVSPASTAQPTGGADRIALGGKGLAAVGAVAFAAVAL